MFSSVYGSRPRWDSRGSTNSSEGLRRVQKESDRLVVQVVPRVGSNVVRDIDQCRGGPCQLVGGGSEVYFWKRLFRRVAVTLLCVDV